MAILANKIAINFEGGPCEGMRTHYYLQKIVPYLISHLSRSLLPAGSVDIQQTTASITGELLPLYLVWTVAGLVLVLCLAAGLWFFWHWMNRQGGGTAQKLKCNKTQDVDELTSPKMALLTK